MRSVASVCLSLLVVLKLFKTLTYELHFRCTATGSECLAQVLILRSSGQGQGHSSNKVIQA